MISLLLVIIYVCFISLGLPDSLLGSGWPSMYSEFAVPLSYAGMVSITISINTIISSLLLDRIIKKTSSWFVTTLSLLIVSLGLFGFSISNKFWMLFIFAIPYGLGAGGIDACLNNYVALHFKSNHMNWLHCMWGIGAFISPYIMGHALTKYNNWHKGYLFVGLIISIIFILVLISFPIWKKIKQDDEKEIENAKPLTFKEIFKIKGSLYCFIMFFCYCSFESTMFLWSSSYLNLHFNVNKELAANLACLFYGGMTLGRAISGFLSFKLTDHKLITIGSIIVIISALMMFIPNVVVSYISLVIMGLGCAPIYPSIIHSTPDTFGKEKSQGIIGMQMAFAYTGCALMPFIFGLIANNISISLLNTWVLILAILMSYMHIKLKKVTLNIKKN